MGFIPLRAVRFQSVLVAAAAAVHTSLLKKRNTNQQRLYNLFYIIVTIIVLFITYIYIYVHISVYIYSCNYDNNQETDVTSENLISATQGEVSVTMWNFTL